jgi:hypothetical protein
VNSSKAGHGRFYQSAVDNPATPANEASTFPGMIQKMKNYIVTRRSVITSQVLTATEESLVPTTPVITVASGASSSVPTNALTFASSAFAGKNGAAFSAMKWRLAEVTEPGAPGYLPYDHITRRLYEAGPQNTWESPELTTFGTNYTFPPIAAKVGHTYRARVKHRDASGRWSHWSTPVSFTAAAPDITVYLQSLVVSQVMYNPAPPSPAEQIVAQDSDSFEWIELMNVGPGPLDLTPVRFTKGVDFNFAGSTVTTLAPGARVVVVNKVAAFNARYAGKLDGVQVAGEWTAGDNLSNGGEQVKLSYGAGTAIRDFTYDDVAPWPMEADAGHALVLVHPAGLPDHDVGTNWRGSVTLHGSPGFSDETSFATWATANGVTDPAMDEDGDGLNNLAEYSLRSSPAVNSLSAFPVATVQAYGGQNHLTFTFTRNVAADDVMYIPEVSIDLANWQGDPANVVLVSETNHGDGTCTMVYRNGSPMSSSLPQFMRLRLQQR